MLELEVVYLEQHLLSLYRKAFDQQLSSVSPSTKEERLKSPLTTPRKRFIQVSEPEGLTKRECSAVQSNGCEFDTPQKEHNGYELQSLGKEYTVGQPEGKYLDSGVYRSHSSLSQCAAFTTTASPTAESSTKSLRACHSQPLSMMEVSKSHFMHNSFTCFFLGLKCTISLKFSTFAKFVPPLFFWRI